VDSRYNPENDPARRAERLFSSAEAREMLDEFRALVRAGVLRVTADNDLVFVKPPAGRERDWPEPPPVRAPEEELRKVDEQVFEWLRQRREEQAAPPEPEPEASALREQVVERLSERILDQWASSREDHTLQQDVADRIAAKILERWTRK
jgi:hypothetical protein